MELQYSGDKSRQFWNKINKFLKTNNDVHSLLYITGCALQDLEGRMFQMLECAVKLQPTGKARKPRNAK